MGLTYASASQIATENITKAGVASKVNVIVGPALASLQKLASEPKFDFVFIDADWDNVLNYFTEAKRLVRKGGVIVCSSISRLFLRLDPRYRLWTTLFKTDVSGTSLILASLPLA